MKGLLKFLKIAGISLLAMALLLTILVIAFVNLSPQFGGTPTEDQQRVYASLVHYRSGKFQNQIPTSLDLTFTETVSIISEFFFSDATGKDPQGPLPMLKVDSLTVSSRATDIARVTWFGHSACLLEIDGRKILIDPMLGQHAGPLPLLSPKRYNEDLPIEIAALPYIDVVIISHDHYDHLDHGSILKLKDKVGRFYVPLGVGAHLKSWGVNPEKIRELNWWQETEDNGFTFVCAPARHFSGRGFTNNTTLWSSWIILSASQRFYFSGDSGYGPHFRQIGEKYGPFDFVMMECGQYNTLWPEIHMMPEETVQATLDVKGKLLLPIHWGAFTLAMHGWTDPISRVMAEAQRLNLRITSPKIGEPVLLDYDSIPVSKWW